RARRCKVAAEAVSTFTLADATAAMEKLKLQRHCANITVSVSEGTVADLPLPPTHSGMPTPEAVAAGSGLCPAGYPWHREGSGWRCADGSHYCSDADLPAL
ncbi:hypothetical protein B484DRAFT_408366, partial [Ochromonadaceae sp. CCMP2298]